MATLIVAIDWSKRTNNDDSNDNEIANSMVMRNSTIKNISLMM